MGIGGKAIPTNMTKVYTSAASSQSIAEYPNAHTQSFSYKPSSSR